MMMMIIVVVVVVVVVVMMIKIYQPNIIIPILHANCIVICEPERANCVGLILYIVLNEHCIVIGAATAKL